MFERLLSLATLGSTLTSAAHLHRFLSHFALVVVLAVMSSIMSSVFVVGLFFASYYILTSYGLNPHVTLIGLGLLATIGLTSLITVTLIKLRLLREMTSNALPEGLPRFSEVRSIGKAFMDGFFVDAGRETHKSAPHRMH